MEPEADHDRVNLYDFIYRDRQRFDSFRAQLLDGKVNSVEVTAQSRKAAVSGGRAGVPGTYGEHTRTREAGETRKSILDPHDVGVTEVLETLRESGRVISDLAAAKSNEFVRVEGEIFFVSSTTVDLFKDIMEPTVKAMRKKEERLSGEMALRAIGRLKLPTICVLRTADNVEVIGPVREEWMTESPAVYEAMHGDKPIPNLVMIGIKEGDGLSHPSLDDLSGTGFVFANRTMAKAIRNMMFPKPFMHVTPLAIFRSV